MCVYLPSSFCAVKFCLPILIVAIVNYKVRLRYMKLKSLHEKNLLEVVFFLFTKASSLFLCGHSYSSKSIRPFLKSVCKYTIGIRGIVLFFGNEFKTDATKSISGGKVTLLKFCLFCLFGWFLNVHFNYQVISRTGPKTEHLTIVRAATRETELGDHDVCLSRSHYTYTDPTSSERAATAGIEPGTSSPGVAHSTD